MSEQEFPRLTPEQLGEKLREMHDPQTPEEWREFHESQESDRQSEFELRKRLPYPDIEVLYTPTTSIHDLPLDFDPSVLEQ